MGWSAEAIQASIDTASNWIMHLTDYESARGHAEVALAAFDASELAPDDRARIADALAALFEQLNDRATADRLRRDATR